MASERIVRMRAAVRTMPPGYVAMVMATGIKKSRLTHASGKWRMLKW